MQTLETLGWSSFFQDQFATFDDPDLLPARVVIEYQDRYRVLGAAGYGWAQLIGNLRHDAEIDRLRRPAVGDWVAVRPDPDMGTVHHLLERRTRFVRQLAGRRTGAQVVAANIDTVFVVTSFNQDFNPRRLERYLVTVWNSGARAVVVLNKADLCDDPRPYLDKLGVVAPEVQVAVVSALSEHGLDALHAHIEPGKTVALVGSSGVGKSTLVNCLMGREVQAVGAIREHDAHGRHTTTHRELIIMPEGGILIDTPGMRELQLWSAGNEGLGEAFADIEALAETCRFRDCAHQGEPGCAIDQAVQAGDLDTGRVASYFKLLGEKKTQDARQNMGAQLFERRRGKRMAKLMRQHKRRKNQ